ncbi:unnamed protein product [Clonostachys rosea]|uniref:F-box domain-containing protein n=1 Tax=Bionectria ochroleuca TaxID=29856 RepID=A0ABY6V345_BIOOC|nr:unnamed protein product [Clonostachys rosea]
MDDTDEGTRIAGIEIANLTRIITLRAKRNRQDEEAQQRARLALGFYHLNKAPSFPQIVIDEASLTGLQFTHSRNNDRTSCRYLPNEIYEAIIAEVLEFEYLVRQRTLVALSASSKRLQSLTEPHLYKRPRGAHKLERQWRFMFSLVLEPQRGHLVQSLEFGWLPRPDNSNLLIDILHACPNVRDLQIQRGSGLSDIGLVTSEDVAHMATIFAASPQVTHFWYATFTEWQPEEDLYGDERGRIHQMCAVDDRFAKFAAQLQELALHGQSQWLARALLHHSSPALKSLTLGQDIDFNFRPQLLSSLSLRSPHLETLEIRCTIDTYEDLVEPCQVWSKSLRSLRVDDIESSDGRVGDVIKTLEALESLHLGYALDLTRRDLEAITQSLPKQRFKSITLYDTEVDFLPTPQMEAEWVDRTISSLLLAHSSTLTELHLAPRSIKLGKPTILSFKQMANLENLDVTFSSDVTAEDVDALLESCPKLHSVPKQVQELSSQSEKWKERSVAKEREFDEEFAKLPPSLG